MALWLPKDSDLARAARGWPAPGVKPTGPVEIDWSNPITKDLFFFWGVNGSTELVRKTPVPLPSGVTQQGDLFIFDGSNNAYIDFSAANGLPDYWPDQGSKNADAVTVIAKARCTDETQDRRLAATWTGSAGTRDWVLYMDKDDGGPSWAFAEGRGIVILAGDSEQTHYDNTKLQTIVGRHRVNPSRRLDVYYEGVQVASSSDFNISGFSYSTDLNVGSDGFGLSKNFHGQVEFVMLFNRFITDIEREKLAKDPYCFLKPANQSPYLVSIPAAAANETTQQYIPRNSDLGRALDGWPGPGVKPTASLRVKPGLGISFAALMLDQQDPPRDLVQGIRATKYGSPFITPTSEGLVADVDGVNVAYEFPKALDHKPLEVSMLTRVRRTGTVVKDDGVVVFTHSDDPEERPWTKIALKIDTGNKFKAFAGDKPLDSFSTTENQWYTVAIVTVSGKTSFWVDGNEIDSISFGGNPYGNEPRIIIGEDYRLASRDFKGQVQFVYAFDRGLTPAEIKAYSLDPWGGLTEPANQTPYLIGVSSGGGATAYELDVTAGSVSLTGQSVGLELDRHLDVTAASVSLTGQTVTLTYAQVGGYSLDVTPAGVSVTGQSVDLDYIRALLLDVTPEGVSVYGQTVTLTYEVPGAFELDVAPAALTVAGQTVTLSYNEAASVEAIYAKVLEIWKLLGLDSENPMTVTPTSRTAGDISQTISGDGTTSTTVTRD